MTLNVLRRMIPFFCLLTVGCAGNVGEKQLIFSVVQVDAGQNLIASAVGVASELISDQERLLVVWDGLRHKRMGSASSPVPEVDFTKERMLFLSMGRQATAGYSLALDAEKSTLSDRMGIVRVLWQEPKPGSMQAQMVTAPYLLLRVSKSGIKGLRVLDQNLMLREEILFSREY